jgi:DNA-binding Lrp family transcriptional regulator
MVEAYVFVVVEPNKIDKVGTEIKKIENAKSVKAVTGEFDLVVELDAKDFSELSKTIKEKILSVPGVIKTSTSVVIETY